MDGESKVMCPWCDKGEIYVEGAGKVVVSVKCPRCKRCYKVRLDDLTAVRIAPHRKLPTPSMKIYHVKGVPFTHTNITD